MCQPGPGELNLKAANSSGRAGLHRQCFAAPARPAALSCRGRGPGPGFVEHCRAGGELAGEIFIRVRVTVTSLGLPLGSAREPGSDSERQSWGARRTRSPRLVTGPPHWQRSYSG
jgi:hypothetical protein